MRTWTRCDDGWEVVRRGITIMKVNRAGKLWRGTVFMADGTSSHTWHDVEDAKAWCEETWGGFAPIR